MPEGEPIKGERERGLMDDVRKACAARLESGDVPKNDGREPVAYTGERLKELMAWARSELNDDVLFSNFMRVIGQEAQDYIEDEDTDLDDEVKSSEN